MAADELNVFEGFEFLECAGPKIVSPVFSRDLSFPFLRNFDAYLSKYTA